MERCHKNKEAPRSGVCTGVVVVVVVGWWLGGVGWVVVLKALWNTGIRSYVTDEFVFVKHQ